jgi:hypothetical protein
MQKKSSKKGKSAYLLWWSLSWSWLVVGGLILFLASVRTD